MITATVAPAIKRRPADLRRMELLVRQSSIRASVSRAGYLSHLDKLRSEGAAGLFPPVDSLGRPHYTQRPKSRNLSPVKRETT
jgi:hypothetical protein